MLFINKLIFTPLNFPSLCENVTDGRDLAQTKSLDFLPQFSQSSLMMLSVTHQEVNKNNLLSECCYLSSSVNSNNVVVSITSCFLLSLSMVLKAAWPNVEPE